MIEVQERLAKVWQNISDMENSHFHFFIAIMHSNDNYRVNMLTCYTVHTFPILFKE